ncbi:PQQ enzyme repeat family protein [Nocardiopsis alba ATCC BAA-2165]|uniref:PQQ enzyme repeat family protein n=1 Tax=Nocardiopsis alba (strain ATCC BAA-2165 / BE74) TaxID=1205910 RepID=J7L3J5_NOCAA|nr:PQQ enzyme repeat family protein [Nocardiopsis alba ATCC BAA-2165]
MPYRRFPTLFVLLSVALQACTLVPDEGSDSHDGVIHQVTDGEVGNPGAITSVSDIGWEWRPKEGERVSEVWAGPAGAVIELDDGFIGLKGDTGEELWRYQLPGVEKFSASFSPSGEELLVAASDEPGVMLNTVNGATIAEDIDWDYSSLLLDGGNILRRQGDSTEALFEVEDLDSGKVLWRQEAPSVCSGSGDSRLISERHSKEVITLILYCAEDVSDEAIWDPAPESVYTLIAIEASDGRELWRQDFENTEDPSRIDVLIFQEILLVDLPGQEKQLMIDAVDGSTIAESSELVLAVDDSKYFVGPEFESEDNPYEIRTFKGEVTASVTLSEAHHSMSTPETKIGLPDQMITVDMERGSPKDKVNAVVAPWGEEGAEIVISGTETNHADVFEPGRLLRIPGAVLLYVPVSSTNSVESIEHVVALR